MENLVSSPSLSVFVCYITLVSVGLQLTKLFVPMIVPKFHLV